MSRATRGLLLAGCALVVLLEAPTTLVLVSDACRGPYASSPSGVALAPAAHGHVRSSARSAPDPAADRAQRGARRVVGEVASARLDGPPR